jgi:sterol desaturase/sphingolipid hydroxylase (fatty acid hydroxylase superfamily)
MHHTDTHLDVTTALRFHPFEIIISILYKSLLISALGLEPLGVLIFEVLLNASAIFNHANIELNAGLDRILRVLIVTPDFHRIHHSRIQNERNSNYGFFMSVWDYLFSTYTKAPSGDKKTFLLGITGYNKAIVHRLDKLLIDPFYSSGIKDE